MPQTPEVHLRMLTSDDAEWLVTVDESAPASMAGRHDWQADKLAAELDEGIWASEDRWGWAIVANGTPTGFALVTGMSSGDADIEIGISPAFRGKGVGREVLRQLADHHFQADARLARLVGRTHEQNVPMQRALNAAGFRMEARYRESFVQPDGARAAEWGYALTRADWASERHRVDEKGYDLHGLAFVVEEVLDGPAEATLLFKFLQEGRRVLARYSGGEIVEGELAGVLNDDVLRYRYVEDVDDERGGVVVSGSGIARLQRRGDGRLEMVNDWTEDTSRHGRTFLVERR